MNASSALMNAECQMPTSGVDAGGFHSALLI
jgi:hypothetical protein